ncbi:MAG: hypothetical protein ABGY41_10195 [Candidatus Poribacteria bacterium]
MLLSPREALQKLVDTLPEEEVESARKALEELLERSTDRAREDAQERVDRQLLATGRLSKIPRREDILNRPKTPRPRMSGKPISQTIIEERR